jgi:hypothetical protein
MMAKCLYNRGEDLPEELLCRKTGFDSKTKFDIEIGKYYLVYAMTINSNYMWYYILENENDLFPIWQPAPLFIVVDEALSRYWVYTFKQKQKAWPGYTTIAFPEWANDPYKYYDALSDGNKFEKDIFIKYKKLMDVEFPNPSIDISATLLDTNWLMCPICIDAWETASTEGMVICPKCQTMMHNPQYSKDYYIIA